MISTGINNLKPQNIPIDTLLLKPQKYNNIYLSVKGYIKFGQECGGTKLYIDTLDYARSHYGRTFVISFSNELDTSSYLKCFDGKYVQLDGYFSAIWTRDIIRSGGLLNINKIQIASK